MVQRAVASEALSPVEIVCFDLGGVLVRISQTWSEACALAGFADPPSRASAPLGAWPEFDRYQQGSIQTEEYLRLLAEFLGVNESMALDVHNAILVEPYPGTLELVSDLHAAGYRTGCLSNTNEPHWKVMASGDRLPAISGLQLKLASHDLGCGKPDPAMFRAFEKHAGLGGSAILFFDDAPMNVRAAKELGWRAHPIDPKGDTAGQMRALCIAEGVAVPSAR